MMETTNAQRRTAIERPSRDGCRKTTVEWGWGMGDVGGTKTSFTRAEHHP